MYIDIKGREANVNRIKWLINGVKSRFPKTNESFIGSLRKSGVYIGKGTVFFSPGTNYVDQGKGFLIRIGDYCKITAGVMILAHDYGRSVIRIKYGENVAGSSPVTIGSNVFIGVNSVILKGTIIGDNCIIGAGSVVSGKYHSDSVIAGNPARVICSLEEYYKKRKSAVLDEACACVKATFDNTGKLPTVKQMGDGFAWIYLPRTKEVLNKYSGFFDLSGDISNQIVDSFMNTKPEFDNFEEFLLFAKKRENIQI